MPLRTAILVLAVAVLGAACGDSSADRQGPDGPDRETAPSAEPSAAAGAAGSSETGAVTASLALDARDGGTSIRVTLDGLTPESRYPVQIHEGPCDGRGRVSLPLGRVTARPDGTGSVRMTVDSNRLPARPFSVHVQDPAGSPVACVETEPTPEPVDS